jgi:tetratricopeptide (TPR) repeat protein
MRKTRLLTGCVAVLAFGAVHAQSVQGDEAYSNYLLVQTNLRMCFDQAQPAAKRITGCTVAIENGHLDKSAAAKVYVGRGVALSAADRNADAITDFTRAIAADPKNLNAYTNRATLRIAANQLDLAIADLTVVVVADPHNGMAFYNRATTYERSGKVEMALDDYQTVMRLQPSFAPAAAAVGRLLKGKDPQAALAQLSNAIQLDPHSPALASRATLYLSMDRFADALRDLDQVVANNAADDLTYLNRGVANARLGHIDAAIRDYARSIELAPSSAAYIDRGNAYAQSQQLEKAASDYNSALALDPKSVPALIGKASTSYSRKQRMASLEDYTHVIELDPANAFAYFKRGNLHLDFNEFAAALSDYSQSLQLDPNQPLALYNRYLAEARLGHREEAAEDRQRAVSLDPSLANAEAPSRGK